MSNHFTYKYVIYVHTDLIAALLCCDSKWLVK